MNFTNENLTRSIGDRKSDGRFLQIQNAQTNLDEILEEVMETERHFDRISKIDPNLTQKLNPDETLPEELPENVEFDRVLDASEQKIWDQSARLMITNLFVDRSIILLAVSLSIMVAIFVPVFLKNYFILTTPSNYDYFVP